jgi:hypothetical protein
LLAQSAEIQDLGRNDVGTEIRVSGYHEGRRQQTVRDFDNHTGMPLTDFGISLDFQFVY